MYPLGHMAAACGTAWLANRELGAERGALARVFRHIDYRAVAFGALLPDLVDKPLVWFVLRNPEEFGGHHIGHSVVLTAALLLVGSLLARQGSMTVLLVAFGTFTHLLYDSVTHVPWSLLYPFVELDVPRNGMILRATNIAGEVAALAALVYLLWRPDREKRLVRFVREGAIEA